MVRANLRNHGDSPLDNARVIMRIDGAEFSVSQVSLAANGDAGLVPVLIRFGWLACHGSRGRRRRQSAHRQSLCGRRHCLGPCRRDCWLTAIQVRNRFKVKRITCRSR